MTPGERMQRAANRLTKWRSIFAGWQLGTRPVGDPESDAVRDHRELTMLLRAEVNGLIQILLTKGIVTPDELDAIFAEEFDHLADAYAQRFPGISATLAGMRFQMPEAANTMKGWRP